MNKYRKVNKLAYIGIVMAAVVCVACGRGAESKYRTESDQNAVSGSRAELESEHRTESDQDAVSGSRA